MNFGIGVSALQASQFGINQVSQNLANATTEGYHRQEVGFQTSRSQFINGQFVGSGVEIGGVRRIRNQILERAYTNTISDLQEVEQRLSIEMRVESFFLTGDGSIQDSLTGFFDDLSRLSANPGESALRVSAVNQAVNLSNRVQTVTAGLVELKHSVAQQLDLEVEALNSDIDALVTLQNQIRTASAQGTPNNLLDQRDQLINRIAEQIDVERYESVQDSLGLAIAGSSVSIGVAPIHFETVTAEDGSKQVQVVGGDREIKFAGGKIAALVDIHNNLLEDYSDKLNSFSTQLIRNVDQAHAVGLGLDGPFTILRSSRFPSDTAAALNESGLPFSVDSGELFISITSPDGGHRLESIDIDPATDSLEDIAAKISALGNIQAVIDDQSGQLSIIAPPGYKFDFAGELETNLDLSSFAGTSIPSMSGDYLGDTNRRFSVTMLGSGTIGKTPGLMAQVTDSDGRVITEINLGDGYEAGTEIELADGAMVSFGIGDVVAGDTFETALVANSDTAGILSALGINSFFHGSDETDISVNSAIVDDPDGLATSRSGEVSDTRNLANLMSLRNFNAMDEGRLTFDDYLADSSAEIGFRVQSSVSIQTNVAELNFQYKVELDAVSGVDVNEELVRLTQHQKSYEAAIQVVRTMESMLDELFQIIR